MSKDVYVIILTARGVELDEEERQQVHADEYMSKPFSPIRIVEHVNTILAKRSEALHTA